MAKGVFTFRITSEGVEELRKQLEALGPSGEKAFAQLKQLSPQLKSGFEQAAKSADAARAKNEQMARGLGAVSASFEGAESSTKKFGRSLNDAAGAFQLLGGLGGSAGSAMSTLGSTVGNVADVFGTLGGLLSKHPLLSIGTVVSVAATAFIAFSSKTADAKKAQEDLQQALERTNDLLLTQAQRADIALEKARAAARGAVDTALPDVGKQAAQAERDLTRLEAAAERQRAAQAKFAGREFDSPAAKQAQAAAEKALAEVEAKRGELNRLLIQRDTLDDPAKFSQRELLFPGRGSQQFRAGGSREDLSEEDARARLKADADAVNQITGEAIERNKAKLEEMRKAGVAAMEAWEAFEERQARLIEQTVVANQKRSQAVEKYIEKLEDESRLAGQTNDEREVGRALFEAQSKLIDEMGNKVRDLTEAERARIAVAVKTKDAMEDQAKAAAKIKQEIDRAAARSTDRLVDFAGDALFDRLSGKVTNFWDSFRQLGQRAIAQIASEMVFRPLIAPIVSAAVGAAPALFGAQGASAGVPGAASGGGLGGLVSSPISSLFSTGGSLLSSAFGGSGGLLQGIGSTVGGLLGFGGGGALGAFSAGAFASTAAATGTAAAAAAGSSLAAGGSLGVAAGAPLAGAALSPLAATGIGALIAIPAMLALGGLFGKKKNVGPFASYAGFLNEDGSISARGGGEKNGGSMAQMQEATRALADGIKQVTKTLGIYSLPRLEVGVGSNLKAGTFFGTGGSEAGAAYFGDDAGLAAATYVRKALAGTLYGGPGIEASTESARIFARTTGDVKKDLEFVAVYQGLDEAASAATQVSMALDELNAKFDEYAASARSYGLEVDRIEKARTKAIEDAVAAFVAPVGGRFAGVESLVSAYKIGPASPLSAQQQLDAARGQFEELSASALGGDVAAQQQLGAAGRVYLDTARGFFGTTERFASIFGDVFDEIASTVSSVRETDPTVRAIVETGATGTAAVTKALGALIDEVQALRNEVRRGNDLPMRVAV